MSAPETTTQQPQTPVFTATQTITVPDGVRVAARVKWFDNAMSYGFATVLEGEHTGKDIFVHQSNILTLGQNVYRTLRAGEYVEFALEETQDNEHKHQAVAVTGPRTCPLMCETNPQRRRTQGHGPDGDFVHSPVTQGFGRGGFVPRGDSQSGFVPRGDSQSGFVPRGDSQRGFVPRGDSQSGFVPRGDSQSGFVPRGDSQSGFVPRGRGRGGRGRGAGRRPFESTN
jgi:cold shock CspA family protein